MTEGTAISHAVRRGDEAMVRLLLKHGAYPDPEVSPFRDTVLATAVKGNHETIARLLLEHGADVDAGCGQRPPPLHCAAMYERPAMAKLLFEYGCDADARCQMQSFLRYIRSEQSCA